MRRRRHRRRGCPRLGGHGGGLGESRQAQEAGREPLVVRARRWVGDVEAVAAGEEEARGAGGGGRGDRGHRSALAAGGWCWELEREQEVGTKGRGCGAARRSGAPPFWVRAACVTAARGRGALADR